MALAPSAAAQSCVEPDAGGTVVMPPPGCGYVSPDDFHIITDGLPPGTTIEVGAEHAKFFNSTRFPGGPLGGETETFDSFLFLEMTGTGDLAGFSRFIAVQVNSQTATGPRNPGDPVQTFPNEMISLQGAIFGDPDFDLLSFRAGSDFGLPSPGETTLTDLGGGQWNVDSFFDISYEIEFVGAPGSVLGGMGGTTQGTVLMQAGGSIDCGPTPDGSACEPVPCPDGVSTCVPACVNYDPATGAIHVLACECRGPNECQVGLGFPEGGAACEVPDNGTGTVTLPPAGCEYLSPDEVHMIIDGLPAGTTIEFAPIHKDFICLQNPDAFPGCPPPGLCEEPGGGLGGNVDCFSSVLDMQLNGTGDLAGYTRNLTIPVECQVFTAPRTAGDPVQDFDTDMFALQGALFGDPDFAQLVVTGGTGFGLPSPGHTTLTQLPNGNFNVDSFFDITYQIDFVGAPGSILEGLSGTTQATIRMETGAPAIPPCVGGCPPGFDCVQTVVQNADGTLDVCCDCVPIGPPLEACCFPDGSCEDIPSMDCIGQGGTPLGPNTVCLGDLDGDGVDDACQCGPNPTGLGCKSVPCPDATQTCVPTCINVDPLTGAITVLACECRGPNDCQAVVAVPEGGAACVVPDDGSGTVTLPPAGCEYLSPDEFHMIADGLPPGTTIEMAPIHKDFICKTQPGAGFPDCPPPGLCEEPGGGLGGRIDCFISNLVVDMTGTGDLLGFNRPNVTIPIMCQVHTGPRNPGDAVQDFDTDMFFLQGGLFGDPDFDSLVVTGGTGFGLPSPGHTTLTRLGPPGSDFQVDSFFDITYRIDYVGAPGSVLEGTAGSTTATIRMSTPGVDYCTGGCPPGFQCVEEIVQNPDGTIDICCNCVPLDCGPDPTGQGCLPVACPDPTVEECLPVCAVFNPVTGQTTVTDCDCRGSDECHLVVFAGAQVPCDTADGGAALGPNGCVLPPGPPGTVMLPPQGCSYLSADDVHMLIDGLPPGTNIELGPEHFEFQIQNQGPGGSLGGRFEQFSSSLLLEVCGTGDLEGFNRTVVVQISCETHTGPRTPGDQVQSFQTKFDTLQGGIFGDPDFDSLTITGGDSFGLPSPGHTTLTELPSGNFNVDSFFDITYRIDFVGAPGSALDGFAGSTIGTIRMGTGGTPQCVGNCPPGQVCCQQVTVLADGSLHICCECVDDPCPWDLSGNGLVDFADLLILLGLWGPCPAPCDADFDGSGDVGFADLLVLLGNWGPCPPCN